MDLNVIPMLPFIFILISTFEEASSYTVNSEEEEITCWTCPKKANNVECNDWAPERFCPKSRTVCQTVHKFRTETAESLQVDKKCVLPSQCTPEHVGCHTEGNNKVCVSCCNTPYCNQEVPSNNETAISLSVTILQNAASSYAGFHWLIVVFAMLTSPYFT